MQRNIVTEVVKTLSQADSAVAKIKSGKSRAECSWNWFVSFVENVWSFFKVALSKVELVWGYVKTAIEQAWTSFWGVFPESSNEIDGALLRVPVSLTHSNARRVGINIGLLYVDKHVYGTDANCPGCDKDAVSMNRILRKYGFETKLFLNNEATWYNIQTILSKYAAELVAGDLLVITAAGHGGQQRDADGDEIDGLDETWLLYDREVPDDDILSLIKKFKQGVRIVLINDQCHSEGNFRSMVRGLQRVVSLGCWGKREGHPIIFSSDDYSQISVGEEHGPSLIQFAGCRESRVSYGSADGGEWTSALISAFAPELSWREWFDKAAKIPRRQSPQWVEYGPVDDSFRNGRVFL